MTYSPRPALAVPEPSSKLLASLRVDVLFTDAAGNDHSLPVGIVGGSSAWQPSPAMLVVEDEGVDFDEAASGEEALERSSSNPYDLILLDQRMPPGLSGIEVAEQLRDEGSSTPIVLYSAFLDPSVEERRTTSACARSRRASRTA